MAWVKKKVMSPKVLIVCFTFPPYPGVGGRRWAKFAKFLHRKGCDVYVISAIKKKTKDSPWEQDTIEYRNKIDFIPSGYPLILTIVPKSIWQKLLYKVALIYVKLMVKGNYYDHSSLWKKYIQTKTERKINEGYNNVIVSCGPFKTSGFVIELKQKYPEVNFIVDFRDPWSNNKTSFGYTSISPKRLFWEQQKEKMVAESYDYILSVSVEMTDYFQRISNNRETYRFKTLMNGFDRDDFPQLDLVHRQGKNLRFIFTGTLYNQSMHMFKEFCEALKMLKIEHENVYNSFIIDFYGHVPDEFARLSSGIDIISHLGEVSINEVYKQIAQSQVAMLFLADDTNYSFSTKFYEYISQKIPIAVFANAGNTGTFIEKNNIGYACFSGNIKQGLLTIHQDWSNQSLRSNQEFDTSQFEVDHLTNKLIELLK